MSARTQHRQALRDARQAKRRASVTEEMRAFGESAVEAWVRFGGGAYAVLADGTHALDEGAWRSWGFRPHEAPRKKVDVGGLNELRARFVAYVRNRVANRKARVARRLSRG
jgi:hypothetical protein